MLLGCIGDDFTGSSDLANTLAKQGMPTVLFSGVPSEPLDAATASSAKAGVIALKSRSINPDDAVKESLAALEWLQAQGCQQFFFKYCSTFDSTDKGNIGPVAEALANAMGVKQVIVCPAFPGTGRSIYMGHLFVNDSLLSESGMQNHPITPMKDADIRRVMQAQCRSSVGHVAYTDVLNGAKAIADKLNSEQKEGHLFMVVDAVSDNDLMVIGEAAATAKLITGGSGVALGLPRNFELAGDLSLQQTPWQGQSGQAVVLSGSCSIATRAQVEHHSKSHPNMQLIADNVISGTASVASVCKWVLQQDGLPIIYSSADPDEVAKTQNKHGQAESSEALEQFFSQLAFALVEAGVTKIIIAGGETSGAVVEGLALDSLSIGPEIDPGVPALRANDKLVLALKSGNFGTVDFFEKAQRVLSESS